MTQKRNPARNKITVQIDKELYDRLHRHYPYAQMKALIEHVINEHLKEKVELST